MCRTGCCGTLIAKKKCPVCFAMAKGVKLLDWRDSITIRWMTQEEFERYHAPVFEGSEGTRIVGFRSVALRVLQELFMPNAWKRRNFIGPLNPPEPEPEAAAEPAAPAAPVPVRAKGVAPANL